jgi:hydroxymethylpyrimidine pyrophosphatase-like HAD family hydrolase
MLEINSAILTETTAYLEKNYRELNIEKKFLKDKKNLLGGITVDWRHVSDWNRCKKMYEEIVKESVYFTLKNPQQKGEGNISKEKLDYYTSHLFIQEYSTHPFVDVYTAKVSKGDAFDFVVSKLSEKSNFHGKIMYLGDSENDNPAFRKADISVGVNSDNRLNPKLDCTYTIKFENLSTFLRRLVDNGFNFSESLLKFEPQV